MLCSHISATVEKIITKFSTVVTHVNKHIFFKFQLICIFVTMVTKYGIYHQFDMGEGLAYNFFYFFFIYLLVICYFVP